MESLPFVLYTKNTNITFIKLNFKVAKYSESLYILRKTKFVGIKANFDNFNQFNEWPNIKFRYINYSIILIHIYANDRGKHLHSYQNETKIITAILLKSKNNFNCDLSAVYFYM